jgi:hypothetical protein
MRPYEEWAKRFAAEVADAGKSGKTVVEAVVNYDEFTQN